MDELKYCLLGPLIVRDGGALIPVAAGKQRVLLAALLLRARQGVGFDEITEALWGAQSPPSARECLHNYVVRLRHTLRKGGASPIITEPGGYRIEVGPDELDVARFESAVAAGKAAARSGCWVEATGLLRDGLVLWRGEPLTGVVSEALISREVPRLKELRLQALEAQIDADLHLARHRDVIAELRRLVAAEPLRERLHELLMMALYQDGQRAAALTAYHAARDVLVAELGVEPGPELQRLQQQILAGGPTLMQEAQGATVDREDSQLAGHTRVMRFSLPPDTAAFTGRDSELGRLTTAASGGGKMAAVQVINGMPGVGKTALAVHAAYLLRDRFPDWQLFVDLHGHTPDHDPLPPEEALAGLLGALGVDRRYLPGDLAGRAGMWRDKMARRRGLLVLDNAASSAQITPLLPSTEGCLVLVTSRHHLADLPGTAVAVPLQTLPPEHAQQMFVRLAPRAATEPGSAVTALANLAGCLPLAISVLARLYRRHPSWSLADLVAETKGGLLTLVAEQDSVAAAFEVSYQHLTPRQQECFCRLGLHPGATIDAYAAAALVKASLIDATQLLDGLSEEGLLNETGYRRYAMHSLIRRYAIDRAASPLKDREEAVGRLLDYYRHTVTRAAVLVSREHGTNTVPVVAVPPNASPDLPDSSRALAWVRAEWVNLLACLDYALQTRQHSWVAALTGAVADLLDRDGLPAEAVSPG